ncbi:hypothetical protein JOD57_002318 [Geodermatophilus bullaregiensis]|uniref:AhpC/TSA family protein n=1 Tax=Geodermatophilus bullaregiensis TaxID=1564160 RepID=UPI00195B8BFE|nr:AhpC/TSA family protein [Geodermatophilus bullaregiensis]MBM7806481.1 hypothetical protein [Geodermatophilus bullaregiensis]
MQEEVRAAGAPELGPVLVGFGPADRLAAVVRRAGFTGTVLSDPGRVLYRRLGIGRAPWWRVYNPGTLALYARALRSGTRLARPSGEDTRQLGGDAVVVDGTVVEVWRPRSPDDRPPAGEVVSAALAQR